MSETLWIGNQTVRLAVALGLTPVADMIAAANDRLTVERVPAAAYAEWQADYRDLAQRADWAQPFMAPAVIGAYGRVFGEKAIVVVAARFRKGPDTGRLAGVWALRRMRDVWTGGLEILQAPIDPLYHLSSEPVLDASARDETLAALLQYIRAAPDLPKTIRATAWPRELDTEAASAARLDRFECWERSVMIAPADATAESYIEAALGKGYRKRKGQERALAKEGVVTFESAAGDAAVEAFEAFLALEAAGWKGTRGTALACRPDDAARVRAMVAALARDGLLRIDIIRLDGRPIAAGLLPQVGDQCWFLKTAYDETLRKHSPGVLLDLAVTRRLFGEGGAVRLCSGTDDTSRPDDQIWSERRAFARTLIALRDGPTARMTRFGSRLRTALKRLKQRRDS